MSTDWQVVPLGDVIDVKHGYAFKGEYFTNEPGPIVMTPGNFHDEGGFKFKNPEKYYSGPIPDGYTLSPGNLLVAMTEQKRGLLGSAALIPAAGTFLHNQRLGLVVERRPGEVSLRFLYYTFNAPYVRRQIQATANGAKVRHTSPSRLKEVDVRLPPLVVQRKIAAVLAAYDELIENNLRRIEILEQMAQAVYREWFVNFRFPGHKDVALVDSPLGPIPDGWSESTVGEAATNFDRLRKPLSKMERAEMQGEYPYYGAAKVFDYVNDYIFDGEYLLVAEDGSVVTPDGYPVLQLVCGKFWANNHTHILQGSLVSTHHLYLALSRVQIMGYVTGAAQPKITQGALNRVPLVVPPQLIRVAFDELIKPMFDLRQNLLEQNANLRATRDLLLPKLVSGEIDVSELEIDTEWLAS